MTETCDFLIIGGGSAGCIIARRLAERTSGRIILLEAGKSDEGDDAALYLNRLDDQTTDYDWGFMASTISGRPPELSYSRAKILGGCGNHNDCAFIIPPPSDFSEWERLGAKGWGPSDVASYFKRVDDTIHVDVDVSKHPYSRAFVAAGRELGLEEIPFRARVAPGVGWFPLNAKGAYRQSSSIGYLHPLSALPKHLEIWTETTALRLIIENGRCRGAETARGPVHAAREVILTAGSINTPQLMMLSGLGPAAHLRSHGITVVADLPGVGQHLLDHVAATVVWETHAPVPPWEVCPFEATMMLQLEPDQPAPDVLFHFGLRVREKYGEHPRFRTDRPAVKASPNVTRARSQGSVCLRSADPRAAPIIDLNYFSDPDGYDIRILVQAMRFTRDLVETHALSQVLKREIAPGSDIDDDEGLIDYILDTCETVYHPAGTAKMGHPADPMSVVTPDLKLKGIASLRICDASIFPAMVTVNINNTVMMIGEKAVDHLLA